MLTDEKGWSRKVNSANVLILDPSVLSRNTGDQIIYESVHQEIRDLLPFCKIVRGYTQDASSKAQYAACRDSVLTLVAGTNLLSADLSKYKQWKIGWRAAFSLNNLVLMGVGWWQYQDSIAKKTAFLYKKTLSKGIAHSVRDSYTKQKLESIGLKSINTGCPTLWRIPPLLADEIPRGPATSVVVTLTDYNRDPVSDRKILDLCFAAYDRVYFWPQGAGDLNYCRQLSPDRTPIFVGCSLEHYDELLVESESIDYLGTRLHAGIRALQKRRRVLIISVDNRATEMGNDFLLPVVERMKFAQSSSVWLDSLPIPNLRLPVDEIEAWKDGIISWVEARTAVAPVGCPMSPTP